MALFAISGHLLVVGADPLVVGDYDVTITSTDQGGLSVTQTKAVRVIAQHVGNPSVAPEIIRRGRPF